MSYEPITPWEEHEFWLGILKDHAYFIRDYLSPEEKKWVKQAETFIETFGKVEQELRKVPKDAPVDSGPMIRLAEMANEVAYKYYLFEGNLLNLRLFNKVNLNLTPTYLNGTLLENREYLRILESYVQGKDYPALTLVELLSMWLDDQLGHASLLLRMLDGVEFALVERANHVRGKFSQFIVKNDMMEGYLHFTEPGFPAQMRFAKEVSVEVVKFNNLVAEVLELYLDDELINQSTLRFLEHHFPESCYFMRKLSYYAPSISYPACKLTKPTLRNLN
ncbi:hypothetical protein B4U37_01070 [Sutcliffiella horikoshii]|uniref:DUF2935 domain-containing protein n=1 Tax=Sutcliffiella horikoshii TaxID=79883 RepID=A0ABM6KEC9_9BACI|nr:DUF2935 domain-containing protein [Sutcliffiella horikoshii]ART74737.1 hypothetical protein B4U37_01070 [Sutcliffiella horikoshii]